MKILVLHRIIVQTKAGNCISFLSLRDLIAPEIIPIELKLANDTKNTDVTPFACSDKSLGTVYQVLALLQIR